MATAVGLVLSLSHGAAAAPHGHGGKGHEMRHGEGGGACHMQMRRPARISVTGAGDATIAPDLAMINLGVTTQAASAAEAMDANTAQQTQVIDALAAEGIEARDIQTSGLNLSPLMEYPEGQPPRVTGYQAQNMVTVRVRDLAALGGTLDTLVGAGANEMNGISFMREDSSPAEDEARTEAVEAARHSAEVLAAASGMVLGPLMEIRDTPQMSGPPRPMMMAREAADAQAVPIQAGELTINASVEVSYALISAECAEEMRRGNGDGPGGAPGEGSGPEGAPDLPPGHPPVPGIEPAPAAPGDAPVAPDAPTAPDASAPAPTPTPETDPAAAPETAAPESGTPDAAGEAAEPAAEMPADAPSTDPAEGTTEGSTDAATAPAN
ncbi:SIMPL domain-containing protein [Paracoccus albicereus]|nr:SIMPL domain-containing protein [Paracoccus albicereus]